MGDITNNQFDFFHGSEADQFNFYRIPKLLFTDKRFSKVSVEAKVLYGLLLDRMSLSVKNGWIDEESRVYIYFKLEDAMEFMSIGKDKGVKLFAELDSEKGCGLIRKKRQGLGKPVIIYVMNFNSNNDNTDENVQTFDEGEVDKIQASEKPNSGLMEKPNSRLLKNRSLEFCKSEANNTEINNNKNINTEFSDTYPIKSYSAVWHESKPNVMDEIDERKRYRELILENIEYEILLERNYDKEEVNGLIDIMLDLVCSRKEYIVINCTEVPKEVVKSRLLKISYEHIEYVLDCLRKNTTKIRNIKSYLATSLYNAPTTIGSYYTAEVNHDLYGGE